MWAGPGTIRPGPGPGTKGPGPRDRAQGPGPRHRAQDPGPRDRAQGPGPRDRAQGPGQGTGPRGPGPRDQGPGPGPGGGFIISDPFTNPTWRLKNAECSTQFQWFRKHWSPIEVALRFLGTRPQSVKMRKALFNSNTLRNIGLPMKSL